MNKFEYKTYQEKRKMAVEELKLYYQKLRLHEEQKGSFEIDATNQARIVFLLRFIAKIDRILNHRALRVLKNESYPTSSSKLYICTKSHYAVETLTELIRNPFSITIEDKDNLSNIERLLLERGILRIASHDKQDQRIIERAEKINLLLGGNEVVFPEFSTNSKNLIGEMGDISSRLIIETGAVIIPIALEEYQKDRKVISVANIGKNLQIRTTNPNHMKELTEIIETELESLKQEIHASYESKARVLKLIR